VNRLQAFKRVEKRLAGRRSVSTTAETSKRMGRVRRHGTTPELVARAIVSSLGVRYTLKNRDLPGSPDLANRTGKFAIFVNGCFWHRHRGCSKATVPKRNRRFWEKKFECNVERDVAVVKTLRRLKFKVMIIWECQLLNPRSVQRHLRRCF
jgi:DNA mismatch endonuclease (patch repair protein)